MINQKPTVALPRWRLSVIACGIVNTATNWPLIQSWWGIDGWQYEAFAEAINRETGLSQCPRCHSWYFGVKGDLQLSQVCALCKVNGIARLIEVMKKDVDSWLDHEVELRKRIQQGKASNNGN